VQIFFKGYDNPKGVLNVWLLCQVIYRFVLFQTGPISILAIMLIETVSAPERRGKNDEYFWQRYVVDIIHS
jgi:hypothetical protein